MVVGKVVEGLDTVIKASNVPTNEEGVPLQPIAIVDCGLIDPVKYSVTDAKK